MNCWVFIAQICKILLFHKNPVIRVSVWFIQKLFQKFTSGWLKKVKKNRETYLIIYESYINITSSRSHTNIQALVTPSPAFAVPHWRLVLPGCPANNWHHLWAVGIGFKVVSSQRELYLEEEMVVTLYQIQAIRRVVRPSELCRLSCCLSWSIGLNVIRQCEHSMFVLDWLLKYFQYLTINLWSFCGPWFWPWNRSNISLWSQNTVAIIFWFSSIWIF